MPEKKSTTKFTLCLAFDVGLQTTEKEFFANLETVAVAYSLKIASMGIRP